MTRRSRVLVVVAVAAAVSGSAAVGVALEGGSGSGGSEEVVAAAAYEGADESYAPSVAADPLKGPELVREALENLRTAERFRFVQTASGQQVRGEVDLATDSSEVPRMRTNQDLKKRTETVPLEQLVIGTDVYTKRPGTTKFAQKKQGAPTRPGKGRKKGLPSGPVVGVVDPVMQLLEPMESLPDSAFGAPRDAGSGRLAVDVQLLADDGDPATVTFLITRSRHEIVGATYARGSDKAVFELRDHADVGIVISAPES